MKQPKMIQGLFHCNMKATEQKAVETAREVARELSTIQPVKKELTDAATRAEAALTELLALAGSEVEPPQPLFDQPGDNAAAE